MRLRSGIEEQKQRTAPPPCAAFFDWLSRIGRRAGLRAHWLSGSKERGYRERPDQGPAWVSGAPRGLWLRRPGLRHWAREDGAEWLPSELLTSVWPGGFAAGESTSVALCLPEPFVQRYRGAGAHIRWRRPPGGLRGCSELGIWRPQLSSHPLLLPVSYPVVEAGGECDRARDIWVLSWGRRSGRLLYFFPDPLHGRT